MNMPQLPTRPFQIIVMLIFGMLALVGLALFASYHNSGAGRTKVGSVTIWGTLPSDPVNHEIEQLKASDKSYQGVTYIQKSADSFDATLADSIAAGNGPDLIIITQEQLDAERNKLNLIPFSSVPQRKYLDTFIPEAELFLTNQGTYGLPLVVDPLVLYYNRPLLATAGVSQPPTSWEAVTGIAPRLTQHVGGQITQSALPFGEYNNNQNARAIISLLFFQSGSPIVTLTQNGTLQASLSAESSGSPLGISPAESALGFYTQFADPAKTVYSWNRALPDARQAFVSGYLALYPGFASEAQILKATNPNLDFDMAPIPQPSVNQTRMTYGRLYTFSIPKASHNAGGAYLTASALVNQKLVPSLARELSMVPARRDALTAASNDRFEPVFYPEALVAKGWLSPLPSTTDSIFSAMISSITSGAADVRDALTRANQALGAAL